MVDQQIRYWLKDIPYLFIVDPNNTSLTKFFRIYLIPSQNIYSLKADLFNNVEISEKKIKKNFPRYRLYDVPYVIKKNILLRLNREDINHYIIYSYINKFSNCEFSNFFCWYTEGEYVPQYFLKYLKINGNSIYYPKMNYLNIPISNIYDYLKIKQFNWFQIEKKYEPLKIIDIGKHYLERNDYKIKQNIVNRLLWYVSYTKKMYKGKDNVCIPLASLKAYESTRKCHKLETFNKFLYEAYTLIIFQNKMIIISPSLLEMFNKCISSSNISTILLLLNFQLEKDAHMNLMIIDKLTKSIYIFDPEGYSNIEISSLDLYDKILCELNIPRSIFAWSIYPSSSFCPNISFQQFESPLTEKDELTLSGHCEFWTFWLIEMRLKNRHLENEELVKLSLNEISKNTSSFKQFIKSYAKYIDYYSSEILKKKIKNNNYLFNYIENIRNDFLSYIEKGESENYNKNLNIFSDKVSIYSYKDIHYIISDSFTNKELEYIFGTFSNIKFMYTRNGYRILGDIKYGNKITSLNELFNKNILDQIYKDLFRKYKRFYCGNEYFVIDYENNRLSSLLRNTLHDLSFDMIYLVNKTEFIISKDMIALLKKL